MTTFMNCDLLQNSKEVYHFLSFWFPCLWYLPTRIPISLLLLSYLLNCDGVMIMSSSMVFSFLVLMFFSSVLFVYCRVGVFFNIVIFSCCLLFSDVVFNVVCCTGTHSTLMLAPSLMVFSFSMLKFASRLVSSLIMFSSLMVLFSVMFFSMETIYFNVGAFFDVTLFFNASDFSVIIFFNVLVFFNGDDVHLF